MDSRYRTYNIPKTCEQCGETFYASRYDATYCGSTCRTRASRKAGYRDALIDKVYDLWLEWQNETRKTYACTENEASKLIKMQRQIGSVLDTRDWQLPLIEQSGWDEDSTE